ncbi:MAG: hypothetical protein CMK59_09345 [Proteobacteria bacterium]|nr:hypothetical protein [Pseudomonadota bacterium]
MRTVLLALVLLSAEALASWGEYVDMFPDFPCSDGWAGCEIDGEDIDLGTVRDAKGRYHPSNERVDFFDFSPLPAFSPFSKLTVYPEEYASAEEPAAEPDPEPAQERSYTPPPKVKQQKEALKPQKRITEPVVKSQTTPPPQPEPVPEPEPQPEPVPEPEAQPEPVPEPEAITAATVEDQGCEDLIALEGSAMMGQLKPSQLRCLEQRIGSSEPLVHRRKASVVLINNARAKGDQAAWERYVKRHLNKLDQSDPNLCLSYSIYLFKKGVAFSQESIRWAEIALENKNQFNKGSDYQKRLYQLYKLRAVSAQRLWLKAEEQKVDHNIEKYKGMTKNFSREWLDFARASGQSIKEPISICVSAADKSFCEG